MYKMVDINKKHENNDIEVIVDGIGMLWLNEKHIEEKLGHKNLPVITNKYDPVYKKQRYELVDKLGFRLHDVINTKEQTVLKSIKDAFEGEDMQTQYSVLGYRIDLYFHKHKLAIEVDELGHADRNLSNEIERQKALEKELDCVFIRINPDEENFNIFKEINKIHRHIKKSTKKSLIDDLSKRLLELEFKSNHSIKSKCLKWIVKKILPTI